MGGLAHYLEAGGIATTQISLIREHTEQIRPPRALWVSFPLGRPLGIPNDSVFQRRVLKHALDLLTRTAGPVLEDFPEDVEREDDSATIPACPVDFSSRSPVSAIGTLLKEFRAELGVMTSWYRNAKQRQSRTTYGLSGMQPLEIAVLFEQFITGSTPVIATGQSPADQLRLAAEDIKALYFEALAAQPGQSRNASVLADWFWGETKAAAVINEVRKQCLNQPERAMQLNAKLLLVPRNQLHRFA